MRKNNDRMLLESLVRKYGKNSLVKAVNRLNETIENKNLENISRKDAIELLSNLSDEYVPSSGKANTLGGEILRAFARLYYRCYNDGDVPYIDYGNETCNSSYRFLHNNHVPGFENEYPSQIFYKEWMTYLNKIIVPFYLWISDEEREQYFTISNNVDSRKSSKEDLEWDKEDDMWDDYDDLDESLHIESHDVNDNKLKNNKTMRKNNDRMLLESLVRKYGKNGVKNAIKNVNESLSGSDYVEAEQIIRTLVDNQEQLNKLINKYGDPTPEFERILRVYDEYVLDVFYDILESDDYEWTVNRAKRMAEDNEWENGTEASMLIDFLTDVANEINVNY